MVRLTLLGPHTRVHASLCASCPSGPAGCCAAPPGLSWADIGRIASLGGAAWLVEEIRRHRLRRGPRGLITDRPQNNGESRKCVYHGEQGCTIDAQHRSAACNYYVCSDALAEGGPEALSAELACTAWTVQYAAWDEALFAEIGSWARWPDGEEEALFEKLGRLFSDIAAR